MWCQASMTSRIPSKLVKMYDRDKEPYSGMKTNSILSKPLPCLWLCNNYMRGMISLYKQPCPWKLSQIKIKFMRPSWGPHESYRPQMGPMLAPWTLLSGISPIMQLTVTTPGTNCYSSCTVAFLPCDKNSGRHGKWINGHTKTTESDTLDSLAPEECQYKFRYVIFKRILVIDGWGISCEITLIWMSLDLNDEKSTLVQVMAWCRQAPSHYLSQSWPRSLSTYGVTRPQGVNVPLTRKANSFVYWWRAFAFSGMY